MKDLGTIREEIDNIDGQIVRLFEKRMELAHEVAEFKIRTGKKVFDREREKSKLEALKALAGNDFNRHGIEELFQQIMSMSRKFQYQLLAKENLLGEIPFKPVDDIRMENVKVVFQGVEGAYSQMAMFEYFGRDVDNFHVDTFRDAMAAIREGKADYAVLPIENSSAGSVTDIYDLLTEFDNYIVGEQIIKIEHALLGIEGASLEDIRTVYSHPQGLMQCAKYLDEHREWKQISLQNTAMSAKKVFDDNDRTQAAIASKTAAGIYGLSVLKEQLNFSETNSTRFIIVTNKKIFRKDADKISICFELPHASGTLYNMLSHFIYNNLSMSKIESRPLEGKNWEYSFFIDFEGNLNDSAVKNALLGIKEEASDFKILGNY
ncbi:prephenate dehydratase [Anaerobium acetethylicum]|uniref:Bifunctional chorismate mutase/prephenate dehydratase n=1 Tax=Anaerobium acetethylicum TaxID=1619234 RepID=A0A1D3TS40_9FIRM|nr:prephenate dehydratase [Anaerobium acetethylicum]SCP96607.1 chorismate mutase [Anaerobium acetethylicum]